MNDYGFVDRICDPGSESLDHVALTVWVQERLSEHRADVLREAAPLPHRGDAVEAWLKARRDRWDRHGESSEFWH